MTNNLKICPQCDTKVKTLAKFRSIKACPTCIIGLVKEEQEFRGSAYNEDGMIDFQREQSEGCLDEYMY